MKTTTLLTTPLALAFCTAALLPAAAQNGPQPAPLPPTTPQRIASIELKSGTLGELVDLLRRDASASILLPGEFRSLPLPEVFLRNVDAQGALQAVDQLLPEIMVTIVEDRAGTTILNITADPSTSPRSQKICRVFKTSSREALKPDELDQFIANVTAASLLACNVNAEAQGRPNAQPPVIKAHASTGLLIVAGDEEDVQLTGQIIAGLGGEAMPLGKSAGWPNGLRIEADTMTLDSKGNVLRLQQNGGLRTSVVELPGPGPEKDLKKGFDSLDEFRKSKDAPGKLFKKQMEVDPSRPPTGR